MEYTDIEKVNGEIKYLPLGRNGKQKNYAMVPERVNAFRKLYPEGFVMTEIVSHDGSTVLMKACAGYYKSNGEAVILGTGFAQEVKGQGMVNGTSYIENCETSAVGRALGMIGLGLEGGGICSAEELVNAITAQNQMNAGQNTQQERPFTPPKATEEQAVVTMTDKVPSVPEIKQTKVEPNPVQVYLTKAMKELREERQITPKENNKLFADQLQVLIDKGLIPNKKTSEYTMEEAEALIEMMYHRFPMKSAELIEK